MGLLATHMPCVLLCSLFHLGLGRWHLCGPSTTPHISGALPGTWCLLTSFLVEAEDGHNHKSAVTRHNKRRPARRSACTGVCREARETQGRLWWWRPTRGPLCDMLMAHLLEDRGCILEPGLVVPGAPGAARPAVYFEGSSASSSPDRKQK